MWGEVSQGILVEFPLFFGFSGWLGTVDCFGDILLFMGTHIDLSVVPPPGGGDVIGASAINLGSTSALGLNGSADATCVP